MESGIADLSNLHISTDPFGQLMPFMAVRQRVVRVVGATLEQATNGTELVSATVATTESGISSI